MKQEEGTMESLGMCSSGRVDLFLFSNWRNYDMLRQLRSLRMKDCSWNIGMWRTSCAIGY